LPGLDSQQLSTSGPKGVHTYIGGILWKGGPLTIDHYAVSFIQWLGAKSHSMQKTLTFFCLFFAVSGWIERVSVGGGNYFIVC
jgi:hypothetical protein